MKPFSGRQERHIIIYPLCGGDPLASSHVDRTRMTLPDQIAKMCHDHGLQGEYYAHLYYPYSGKTFLNSFVAEPIPPPPPPVRVTVDYGRQNPEFS